ncbi:S8 family serine peptidase [Saccharothrix sp. S26]|uniref:S8 family serine peptidase n=1 Tax=Saccharothrix sp. S26 TaxID=2907215 RepID=UPI001F23CFCE|nr:S8 family serine peptidase [Saccharothrix sp. S26]MCE6997107.1 S8 family serine peptidase [Saccharothrix sp. S26]
MRRARWLVVALLAAGLSSPAAAQAAPVAGGAARTITLITGDKVVVDARGALVRVEGRPGARFVRYVERDHQFVVPEDALDELAHDRLDKRFFDITALLDFGYDDAATDRIPLLSAGFRASAAIVKSEAARRWADRRVGVRADGKLWLDGKARITLDQSVPMVGAPDAWQAGFDGSGVTVAVLDTGYDQGHPELADVVVAARDFTGEGIQDDVGHGTHVAATVAGRGGRYSGVAKGAKLAVGRVCGAWGCPESAVIAGMEWAAREVGAKVVNLSLGGDQSDGSDPLSQAVDRLTAETGTLFVVAAGNDYTYRKVSAPAAADGALAVANLTKQGQLNESSSRGPRIGDYAVKPDLAAPGTDIVAARASGTLPDEAVGDLHARLTGTSMAAPHVAGAAAILAQRHPAWTAPQLKAQLMASAEPVADSPDHVGTGLLDVGRAVGQPVRADVGSLSFGLLEWPHTAVVEKSVTYHNDGDRPVTLAVRHDLGDDFTVPSSVTVPAHGSAPMVVRLDPRKGVGTFFGHVRATAEGVELTTSVGAYVQEERHPLTVAVTGRDGKAPSNEFLLLVDLKSGKSSTLLLDAEGRGTVELPVSDYAVLGRIEQHSALAGWYTPVSVTEVAGKVTVNAAVTVELNAADGKPITVDLDDDSVRPLHRDVDLSVPMEPGKSSGVTGPVEGSTPVYGLSFGEPLPQLTYSTTLKAARPRVALGGFDLPVRYADASPYFAPGTHRFRTARRDGDVKGALVVVESTGEDLYPMVRELKDSGASAVLLLGPLPFPNQEQTALPVLSASDHGAQDLLSRIGGEVEVRAIDSSPVSYNLFFPERGALPAGKAYRVERRDLAEVKARYRSSGGDGLVRQRLYPVLDGAAVKSLGVLLDEALVAPVARTEYYSAGNGVGWYQEGFIGRMFGVDARDPLVGIWSDLEPVAFRPGRQYRRDWNAAVAGPRLDGASLVRWAAGGGVTRTGDGIEAEVSPFATATAVESWAATGYGGLELKRDGVSLGSTGDPRRGRWQVPAEPGRYELSLDAARGAPQLELSTAVRTTWGFTSAGTAQGKLPLLQVGYEIPLDLRNSARAALPLPVRFTASRQAGAGKATVREVKAFASFDDGATWVPVTRLVPARGKPGGYVSLRVVASDTDGNTVDQTVLRAYRLRA